MQSHHQADRRTPASSRINIIAWNALMCRKPSHSSHGPLVGNTAPRRRPVPFLSCRTRGDDGRHHIHTGDCAEALAAITSRGMRGGAERHHIPWVARKRRLIIEITQSGVYRCFTISYSSRGSVETRPPPLSAAWCRGMSS